MSVQTLKVTRIAQTMLSDPNDTAPWVTDWMEIDPAATEADTLAEFAGRGCYQSWHKPNPATATNQGYVEHVLDVGHYTLFGHASVTYMIEGVSRSLTHELVRHRFPTFSQLSQRYVKIDGELPYVVPPLFRGNGVAEQMIERVAQDALNHYNNLLGVLAEEFPDASKKQLREAARCVLPNMTETKIVVSANLRAWRDMLELRLSPTADAEIRELAEALLIDLKDLAPNSFADLYATPPAVLT